MQEFLRTLTVTQTEKTSSQEFTLLYSFNYTLENEVKSFQFSQKLIPYLIIPVTAQDLSISLEEKGGISKKILYIDSGYLELSSKENLEVVFDEGQPDWLDYEFVDNYLVFTFEDV